MSELIDNGTTGFYAYSKSVGFQSEVMSEGGTNTAMHYPEAQPAFSLNLSETARMFRHALLVVDETGLIQFQSQLAASIIAAGGVIGCRNGKIFIDRASIQRSLEATLKRSALAGKIDDGATEVIGIPDRSGAIRYALSVISVWKQDGRSNILLSVIDFVDGAGASRATFASVFRLSVREAELAELFSQGLRLEEISATMGVALNTARVHLRRIFLKTNCSGQLALMRLLSRLSMFSFILECAVDFL